MRTKADVRPTTQNLWVAMLKALSHGKPGPAVVPAPETNQSLQNTARRCPLLGLKRKWFGTALKSGFDPQRTFGRHLLSSGKVLELPICSHARPGTGLL